MKKVLFAAVLFAGTSLGFAKDNVKKIEVEATKKEVVAKNQQTETEENLDLEKKLRFCFETYYWTTSHTGIDVQTGGTVTYYVNHVAQYSYLCGENDPRSTTIIGNPADYGL